MVKNNSTLLYDERSTSGRKSDSIQVTADKRFYSVGLFDEGTGTAETL